MCFSSQNARKQEILLKNFLLVGGAGFLGANTAVALLRQGFNVSVVDRICLHLRYKNVLAGVAIFFMKRTAPTYNLFCK